MNPNELTDLQRQVYDLLLQHRYANAWTQQHAVALQQQWIARQLNVQQGDISNAMLALRRAKLLARCGTPRAGRPQIYLLVDPAVSQLPDSAERERRAREHIDPDREKLRETATPYATSLREPPWEKALLNGTLK